MSIRELRNHGGEVVDQAANGERIEITRGGRPVAALVPLEPDLPAEVLLERWRRLPPVDPDQLRADIDEILDPSL